MPGFGGDLTWQQWGEVACMITGASALLVCAVFIVLVAGDKIVTMVMRAAGVMKLLAQFAVKKQRFEQWLEREERAGVWDIVWVPFNLDPELELIVLGGHDFTYAHERANIMNLAMLAPDESDLDDGEGPSSDAEGFYVVKHREEDEPEEKGYGWPQRNAEGECEHCPEDEGHNGRVK